MPSETTHSFQSGHKWKNTIATGTLSVCIYALLSFLIHAGLGTLILWTKETKLAYVMDLVWAPATFFINPASLFMNSLPYEPNPVIFYAIFHIINASVDFTLAATLGHFAKAWWLRVLIAIASVFAGGFVWILWSLLSTSHFPPP